jgi:hypothetical protein
MAHSTTTCTTTRAEKKGVVYKNERINNRYWSDPRSRVPALRVGSACWPQPRYCKRALNQQLDAVTLRTMARLLWDVRNRCSRQIYRHADRQTDKRTDRLWTVKLCMWALSSLCAANRDLVVVRLFTGSALHQRAMTDSQAMVDCPRKHQGRASKAQSAPTRVPKQQSRV